MPYSVPFLAIVSRPGIKDALRASDELCKVVNSVKGVSSHAVDFVVPGKIFFTIGFDKKETFKSILAKKLMSVRMLDSIHLLSSVTHTKSLCLNKIEVCSFERELKQMLSNTTSSVRQCIDLFKLLRPCITQNKSTVTFKCKSRGIKRNGKTLISSNDICKMIGTILEEFFPGYLEANIQSFDVCFNVGTVRHKQKGHAPSSLDSGLLYISVPVFVQSTKHNHELASWLWWSSSLHMLGDCQVFENSDLRYRFRSHVWPRKYIGRSCSSGTRRIFIGCEINRKRVCDAKINLQRAVARSKVCLVQADSWNKYPCLHHPSTKLP